MLNNTPIPSDADVRVHILPQTAGEHRFVVLMCRPPQEATPAAFAALLATHGAVAAYLTHDAGVSWPDRIGQELALRALDHDGIALLRFATLTDAMQAKARAERARQ